MAKTSYVSCIKIKGVSILPPLMTEKKREEMRNLRLKAIEIENKLKQNKNCNENNHKKDESIITNNFVNNSLEHHVTFNNTTFLNESCMSPILPNDLLPETYSFYTYNKNLSAIDLYKDANMQLEVTDEMDVETIVSNDVEDKVNDDIQVPRLIRSNSYILESPSPLLLAFLKQQNDQTLNAVNTLTKNKIESDQHNTETKCNETFVSESIDERTSTESEHELETTQTIKEVIENNFSPTAKKVIENIDTELQLKQILNNIPEIYSQQILQLFEKQKDSCNTNQTPSPERKRCFSEGAASNYATPFDSRNVSLMTSSQTIYVSLNDSDEMLNHRTNSFFENETITLSPKQFLQSNNVPKDKKEWAASKIGAAVKGYLVRRLMRTERVQGLIQTLKDAVICAMELHRAEDIVPSDVELHRRLLQQVSAACYAFYEIFFEIPISEQMAIIAHDRQRKIDLSKRPLSAHSRSSSGRSRSPSSNKSASACKPLLKKNSKYVKV